LASINQYGAADIRKELEDVLQLPRDFVRNVASLLLACHSWYKLHVNNYEKVAALIWAENYRLLPEYFMPPGLHILLVHVPQLQQCIDYPVSRTSEEEIESLHKIIRGAIRNHTLLTNAKTVNESLLRYLYIISDPVIASLFQ